MRKNTLITFSLILVFVLPSCGLGGTKETPEPEFQIEQTSENLSVPITEETPLTVNNCGDAKPEQTIRRKSTIRIDGEASLGVNYQILEGKILSRYGIEQQYEVEFKIGLEENRKYTVEVTWIEDEFQGFITTGEGSGKVGYTIRIPKYANTNIQTSYDCRYEHFKQSIEPPIRDERVLNAIQMGIERDNWPLAKQLMAEAGYPDGIHVDFLLSRFEKYGSSIESAEIKILVENLAEIGIWVNPISKD